MSRNSICLISLSGLMLFACSENGSPVSSNGLDRPSSAPTTMELQSNYRANLTDSQITADLGQIASLSSLSGVLSMVESAAPAIPAIGASSGLAKKTVAYAICQSFDLDTSLILGSDTISTITRLEKNGSAYQLCVDNSAITVLQSGSSAEKLSILGGVLSGMDGVTGTSSIISRGATQNAELNASSSIAVLLDQTGAISNFSVSMDAVVSVDVTQPQPWNLYAEFSMDVNTDVTKIYAGAMDEALTISGTANVYLLSGFYQCTMNYTGLSDTTYCDLMHNGLKVGSLTQAPNGALVVLNADHQVVTP